MLASSNKAADRRIPRILKKYPRVLATLFGLALLVTLIVASEIIFGRLDRSRYSLRTREVEEDVSLLLRDPDLGYWVTADSRSHVVERVNGEVVADATYTTDAHHRRNTPMRTASKRDKFAIFFGCSFTWGDGVNDDETLPYYFGECAANYQPYNYAMSGWGTQQMLVLLQKKDIEKDITQPTGYGVYVLIDDHVRRVACTMSVQAWVRTYPHLEIAENGDLANLGSFETSAPFRTMALDLLGKSNTLRHFNIEIPPITERHFALTARIVKESADLFHAKFPESAFCVLLYPYCATIYGSPMRSHLESLGIRCLDRAELGLPVKFAPSFFAKNHHPRPEINLLTAQGLVKALNIAPSSPG
jgi:hypothetical protein